MSRTFHPFGRPYWRRPITHEVHRRRWIRFLRNWPEAASGNWNPRNWRWPKCYRGVRNRRLRRQIRCLVYRIDHDAVVLPTLREQYYGYFL